MGRGLATFAIAGLLLVACGQAPATPTPAGSPAGTPSTTAGAASPSPAGGTTGPTASPPAGGGFPLDSIVAPVVDGLNLRAEPGTAGERLGMLGNGSQSFVVAGPSSAEGYSWYQLSGLGLPPASGCTTPIETEPFNCPIWFGWAASASVEGVPWLQSAQLECPVEAPYEAEDFNIGKPPLHLLHCYGGDTLRLRAWLPDQEPTPCTGQDAVPWLACPEVTLGWGDDYPSGLSAAIDPEAPVTLPATNQWVEITGHMDHPRAGECRPFPDQPEGQAAVFCRAVLVLESISPTSAP